MKCCAKCGVTRPLSEFYKREGSADGVRSDCKECVKQRTKARYFNTLDAQKEYFRKRYQHTIARNPEYHAQKYAANPELAAKRSRQNYERHRKQRIEAAVLWAKNNRHVANAHSRAYKAAKINACPPWVRFDDELKWLMQEAYELAALRTKLFGFAWHVDHVVPLRAKQACGLHVPWNLAVIPGSDNCRKQNRLEV